MVQVYGSGELPFELALPTREHLRCAWNASSGKGEIESRGWTPAFSAVEWQHYA
jgi:hypothetical protein